jgi:hypothetical protein
MKIVVVVLSELSLPVSDLVAEVLRIFHPPIRARVAVVNACKSCEFPDRRATVAVVFDFCQEVDLIATPGVSEVVPEIVVHHERGRVMRPLPQRRHTAITGCADR